MCAGSNPLTSSRSSQASEPSQLTLQPAVSKSGHFPVPGSQGSGEESQTGAGVGKAPTGQVWAVMGEGGQARW